MRVPTDRLDHAVVHADDNPVRAGGQPLADHVPVRDTDPIAAADLEAIDPHGRLPVGALERELNRSVVPAPWDLDVACVPGRAHVVPVRREKERRDERLAPRVEHVPLIAQQAGANPRRPARLQRWLCAEPLLLQRARERDRVREPVASGPVAREALVVGVKLELPPPCEIDRRPGGSNTQRSDNRRKHQDNRAREEA